MNDLSKRTYRIVKRSFLNKVELLIKSYKKKNVMLRDLGMYNIINPRGRCLLSYITSFPGYLNNHPDVGKKGWDPLVLPEKMSALSENFHGHQMYWESAEIIRQLIERKFIVDCIYSRDGCLFDDVSDYDLIIDEWCNLPNWETRAPTVNKLFYATGSHWLFHNAAELRRHEWLFARRGISVPTARQTPALMGEVSANLISCLGNKVNQATFGTYSSKVRKLWSSSVVSLDTIDKKNWTKARSRFLYFAGGGWVHKGLDLTIEAFLKEPNLELIICGGDNGFLSVYGEEIAHVENISYEGHLNPNGERFRELANSVCAVVYPTSSEGCSGAIVHCMHYGLIPLVTEITGLEVHHVWPPLEGSTDQALIENIRQRCNEIARLSDDELDAMSHFFFDHAHNNHSRAAYSTSLSKILDELISLK